MSRQFFSPPIVSRWLVCDEMGAPIRTQDPAPTRTTGLDLVCGLALALPDSAAETVEIDMSSAERDEYDNRKGSRTSSLKDMMRRESKPKTWVVEMQIASSRMACAGACDCVDSCAKLEWLLSCSPSVPT